MQAKVGWNVFMGIRIFPKKSYKEVTNMNTNMVNSAVSAAETARSAEETKKTKVTSGRTIGDAKLSDKAQKYYSELQKKFGNMDFILVSPEMKEMAEANAGAYANANRTVVLIDTDKIEKMAEDEEYRAKYEGIISNAGSQIAKLKTTLNNSGANVKTFGMKFDDGGNASFFAVIDKSLAAQRSRIAANAEKKAADRKEAAKKAKKEAQEEKRAEKRSEASKSRDEVTITASSVEELGRKVKEYLFDDRINYVETEEEKRIGHLFDSMA